MVGAVQDGGITGKRLEAFSERGRVWRAFKTLSAILDLIQRPVENHRRVWAWSGLVTMDTRHCLAPSHPTQAMAVAG